MLKYVVFWSFRKSCNEKCIGYKHTIKIKVQDILTVQDVLAWRLLKPQNVRKLPSGVEPTVLRHDASSDRALVYASFAVLIYIVLIYIVLRTWDAC